MPLTPENRLLEKEFFGWSIEYVLPELTRDALLGLVEPELHQVIGDKFVVAMKAIGSPLVETLLPDYQHFFMEVIGKDEKPERFNHLGVMKAEVKKFFAKRED